MFPPEQSALSHWEGAPAMSWIRAIATINLLEVFSYYLMAAFAVGTLLRLRNYRIIYAIVSRFSNRWPKVLALLKTHWIVLGSWQTILPLATTFTLLIGNFLASQFIWQQAQVTFHDLVWRWIALPSILATGGLMLYLDARAILDYGKFDRNALETALDKAEHWLDSWQAPVIRFLTFGLINPRRIVNEKVQEALDRASLIVNGALWRWSLQISLRAAFCFTLWMTWAWGDQLAP